MRGIIAAITSRIALTASTASIVCGSAFAVARADRLTESRPALSTTQPGVAEYQRGVRINWRDREVEVDGQVVLREGALELFACSPLTREHESIVCIDARPLHVFQALGLIGLTPGRPSDFDPDTGRYSPARGDPVEIEVRYLQDGRVRREPIERWMRRAKPGDKPGTGLDLPPQPWVFAGSYTTDNGSFAADPEGTVIAVVDFSSSIVALPEYHSDSNAELWLVPATERIPPLYSRCTLVFRHGPVRIRLDSVGRVEISQRTMTMAEATRTIQNIRGENPNVRLWLTVDPQCPADRETAFRAILDRLKIPAESITISRAPTSGPVEHNPQGMLQWVRKTTSSETKPSTAQPPWAAAARRVIGELATRTRIFEARTENWVGYLQQLRAGLRTAPITSTAPSTQPNQ
ncbi:MAG TPA: YdjY domain-containing protein [Phycisphaerae bacterium]|nr:YdjY domain-containing protein [Phycisphaerae bacterium]HRR85982.1 YdjY domain-containing protein [Phycisphaerae bacterium]